MGINKSHYGADLTDGTIFILDSQKVQKNMIVVTKRVGIKKSIELPWRFYIKDNPYVSKK